jgi:hypothetical protein
VAFLEARAQAPLTGAHAREPEHLPVSLHKPVPALDLEKPIDLLARGEWQTLLEVLSGLESPGFS